MDEQHKSSPRIHKIKSQSQKLTLLQTAFTSQKYYFPLWNWTNYYP
jgi:hypothetical protein